MVYSLIMECTYYLEDYKKTTITTKIENKYINSLYEKMIEAKIKKKEEKEKNKKEEEKKKKEEEKKLRVNLSLT
jgi:prophage tail gpP-like protein